MCFFQRQIYIQISYYNMNWLYISIMFLKKVKCVLKELNPATLLYLKILLKKVRIFFSLKWM